MLKIELLKLIIKKDSLVPTSFSNFFFEFLCNFQGHELGSLTEYSLLRTGSIHQDARRYQTSARVADTLSESEF